MARGLLALMFNNLQRVFHGDVISHSPGFPIFKKLLMVRPVQVAQALLRDCQIT
jgi:hypothetical protein